VLPSCTATIAPSAATNVLERSPVPEAKAKPSQAKPSQAKPSQAKRISVAHVFA